MKVLFMVYVILFSRFQMSRTDRRIIDGTEVTTDDNVLSHQFMVYFLSAENVFLGWQCGGAIISEKFALTSAACVEDVDKIYAIAGYDTYVKITEIDAHECTKSGKKRVIRICVPAVYKLDDNIKLIMNEWTKLDIAVAEVETPFDLTTKVAGCTWIPRIIQINMDIDYGSRENTDAIVFGWGSTSKMRENSDLTDNNSDKLLTSTTILVSKTICQEAFKVANMDTVIKKYMLCTKGAGNIDYKGDVNAVVPTKTEDGCTLRVAGKCIKREGGYIEHNLLRSGKASDNYSVSVTAHPITKFSAVTKGNLEVRAKVLDLIGLTANDSVISHALIVRTRLRFGGTRNIIQDTTKIPHINHRTVKQHRNINRTRKKVIKKHTIAITFEDIMNNSRKADQNMTRSFNFTRRGGICQNDHGGPLVSWIGGRPKVIGVSSVFQMNPTTRECQAPNLFTSTFCNSVFIQCVLDGEARRSTLCSEPASVKGFDIIERRISWGGPSARG